MTGLAFNTADRARACAMTRLASDTAEGLQITAARGNNLQRLSFPVLPGRARNATVVDIQLSSTKWLPLGFISTHTEVPAAITAG